MRSMSGSENSVFDICFFVSMDGWLVGTSGEVAPGVPGIFRSGWPTEDSVAGIFAVSKRFADSRNSCDGFGFGEDETSGRYAEPFPSRNHSKFHPLMNVAVEGNEILVTRPNDEKEARSLHGLTRTLIHNMVVGVTEGFRKDLEIQGVGYRAAKQGNKLTLTLGFSHPVEFEDTDTIKIELKDALHFSIVGIDKQEVGQFAAEVRGVRPPEPYKGKGIRYVGEYVIRKEGKAGKGK